MKIQVYGIPEIQARLKNATKMIRAKVQQANAQVSIFMQAEVKASISKQRDEPLSVKSGTFLRSITASNDETSATISSNVEYARYLEYGTSKINPRRHFANSLERNKEKIDEYYAKKLAEVK
jgi:HK97 gp10 family phage protein